VTSVGENEEKANKIQPPFLYFSHLQDFLCFRLYSVRFYITSAIVFNSYNELESDAMNVLYSMFPSLYTIGPLPSLFDQTAHNHLEF